MAHLTWEDYREQVKAAALEEFDLALDYEDGELVVDAGVPCIDTEHKTIDLFNTTGRWLAHNDNVTGNCTGSYRGLSTEQAAENIAGVVTTRKFQDLMEAYDLDEDDLHKLGPKLIDVTIRSYLLEEMTEELAETVAARYGLTVIDSWPHWIGLRNPNNYI